MIALTPKERMTALSRGEYPDRIPFMPTVIEHAAFLIGETPSAAAQVESLMARAHIEAYRKYRPDAVTVGMDLYNIEAEALGCRVQFYDNASIPGIITHPFTLEDCKPSFSQDMGRIQVVLDAATAVKDAVGNEVNVSVGICGPFSIMIELLGFEAAIEAFYNEDNRAALLLDALLQFQKDYCTTIVSRGLDVTVFESWASPPLISPDIYRLYALPYERELFRYLADRNVLARPLVIGGDTRATVDYMLMSGTTLLVSDYNTPLPLYAEKARENFVTLRANIDPKQVRNGDWKLIQARICEIKEQAKITPKLIAGTGVIPYDTPPEHVLRVKEMLKEAGS